MWYLITVPNMNNKSILLWDITTNIQNVWKKWPQLLKFGTAKCSFTSMSGPWYLITVPYKQNHILRDITTNTENLWNNSHNYSNLAPSQILFYMHLWPMVPDHGTQYEKYPSSHGMEECAWTARQTDGRTVGLMDRQTGPFPIVPDSA